MIMVKSIGLFADAGPCIEFSSELTVKVEFDSTSGAAGLTFEVVSV